MAAWLALMLIVAIAGREGMRAQRILADGDALATRLRSGSGKPRSVWPDIHNYRATKTGAAPVFFAARMMVFSCSLDQAFSPKVFSILPRGFQMRILSAVASVFLMALTASAAHAERRVAFVVGNGAYKNVAPLPNPPVDAKAMAGVLRNVGFEVVEGTNLTRDKMTEKLLDFGKRAQGADVAVFFTTSTSCSTRPCSLRSSLPPPRQVRATTGASPHAAAPAAGAVAVAIAITVAAAVPIPPASAASWAASSAASSAKPAENTKARDLPGFLHVGFFFFMFGSVGGLLPCCLAQRVVDAVLPAGTAFPEMLEHILVDA
jgi:hypothetical protein